MLGHVLEMGTVDGFRYPLCLYLIAVATRSKQTFLLLRPDKEKDGGSSLGDTSLEHRVLCPIKPSLPLYFNSLPPSLHLI